MFASLNSEGVPSGPRSVSKSSPDISADDTSTEIRRSVTKKNREIIRQQKDLSKKQSSTDTDWETISLTSLTCQLVKKLVIYL